jgi:shikimate dehydrogenase
MLRPDRTRLEVWGDPVAHSRSPQLHAAAYRVLGLDWTYERRQVSEAAFPAELTGLPGEYRGLSLTMPLKGAAHAAASRLDARARSTGAVNTLLLSDEGPAGFNTDVGGIVRALQEAGIERVASARIIGAGSTATSAIVALRELGAEAVEVVARRSSAVVPLVALGESLGIRVTGASFGLPGTADASVSIATLPGGTDLPDAVADALASRGGLLLDAVYGHWPTALAQAWERAGLVAMSGIGMLLHQALLQVRIFVNGDADAPLESEKDVLAAMRRAVVGD